MRTAVVLFTRDLRLHDNPALAAACANAEQVVPLFVFDPALAGRSPNRDRFLHQSVADLRAVLRDRGSDLVLRQGDPVAETIRLAGEVGAEGVALAADVSRYAKRRERRLTEEGERHRLSVRLFPGLTIVDPGALKPGGGDHYRVFSPYHRSWQATKWRDQIGLPKKRPLPSGVDVGRLPDEPAGESPGAVPGGETAARRRLRGWVGNVERYDDLHNDLAGDGTSRLSPYLRFGCLSPLEVAHAALARPAADPFVRQLCWRDFYYQVAQAFPEIGRKAYRRGATESWQGDDAAFDRWAEGRTGVPIVDAGMHQLRREGWMHNRARLVTASYLTKDLGVDWRRGLGEFGRWLLDGDLPNNAGNWQWTAGTGNDTRPYRRFNPERQRERYDPDGEYVARYS
ncbi:deoxyribodipyrimidine photo-lyase [Asanoa ferruginea]|uniref:Deoxyribodipyrimidine photo-lyase n=1 Tax=Asanoa ferruginea TaxID=53367 RepID=A0A3D9ZJH0_9ACTN|nr:deoxyribodipyrimidine photo-lyase [Asanoa ferruginea]REF96053.1 deoxyribodipyrimidine photo-lyase [Asanoa ferruginea]GIF48085.1 deoxyribodipyrimidine photo-lyase [Asanoa ferruginea]